MLKCTIKSWERKLGKGSTFVESWNCVSRPEIQLFKPTPYSALFPTRKTRRRIDRKPGQVHCTISGDDGFTRSPRHAAEGTKLFVSPLQSPRPTAIKTSPSRLRFVVAETHAKPIPGSESIPRRPTLPSGSICEIEVSVPFPDSKRASSNLVLGEPILGSLVVVAFGVSVVLFYVFRVRKVREMQRSW